MVSGVDTAYRTWHTNGRGVEQLSYTFPLKDILPWGRQEEWLDSTAPACHIRPKRARTKL